MLSLEPAALTSEKRADAESTSYSSNNKRRLVHVYTGNGKGKTTAALGLALRAVGHGLSVYIIQFMKGSSHSGEFQASRTVLPQMRVEQYGRSCPFYEQLKAGNFTCEGCLACFKPAQKTDESDARDALNAAYFAVRSGKYDLVVLDEINVAVSKGLVDKSAALELISTKAPRTELVMTGRNASPEVISAADLVTEMREVKHPFRVAQVFSRQGIEY